MYTPRRLLKLNPFTLILALLLPCGLLAQEVIFNLAGEVLDPAGGRIPGAEVTVRNPAGVEKRVTTDPEGLFVVSGLAAGKYAVSVLSAGFAAYENPSVDVTRGGRKPLRITLRIAPTVQDITVTPNEESLLEGNDSLSMLVLRGAELEALPDDPDNLAMVLGVLAGNPAGLDLVVDGFPDGQLPPKNSIREIRINQEPFSAQYAQPGQNRVEIITKPGTDTIQGALYSYFNDASLNSRNPFAQTRAPFQSRFFGGRISAPIVPKRSSFFIDFQRNEADENAVIHATILDADLRAAPFNAAVLTPQRRTNISARVDSTVSNSHTLVGRYSHFQGNAANAGIGGFSLLTRAYSTTTSLDTIQLTETAFTPKVVNEMRFQYVHNQRRQFGNSMIPTIRVPDAFIGGASDVGTSAYHQDTWEFRNTAMWIQNRHSMRIGGHARSVRISDFSPRNFGGTFVFAGRSAPKLNAAGEIELDGYGSPIIEPITTLESYRRTLFFQQMGKSTAETLQLGGEPSQFSIAGGDARAKLTQYDASVFVQDDWRLLRNFTLSGGLRYEAQNHVQSNLNFAPRLGFSWAPRKASTPKLVFRGGFGLFYDRFSETLTLDAIRRGGLKQQQYIVSDPSVLDLFPDVPPVEMLNSFAVPQTVTHVADGVRAPYLTRSSFSVERKLPANLSLATTYVRVTGLHLVRSRNINAPLPDGLRSFGSAGEIFQYETSGRLDQSQLITSLSQRFKRLSYYVTYTLSKAESDTDGAGSFPADSYNLKAEYGRSSQDIRHTLYVGGWITGPFKITLTPVAIFRSGVPFDITTGRDTNGDSLYTERPVLAGSESGAGAIVTHFGVFDLSAPVGQPAIPRNYGVGPGFAAIHLRIGKTITLSSEPKSTSQKTSRRPPSLNLTLTIQNVLNHTNPAAPVGNLSSPLFGKSYSSAGDYGFGSNSNGNRRIEAQIFFNF